MYEDEGAEPAPAYPAYGGGIKSRLSYHFEGLIPLILILIIAAVAGGWLGFWEIPYVSPQKPLSMLIIGNPTADTLAALDKSQDLVKYVIRDEESLRTNSKEKLAQYDVVWLDQSNQQSKELPSTVGEALSSYVTKGGKLVVVKNSGILNPDAPEIVGWMANFGSEIVPVDCVFTRDNYPSCTSPLNITGELERADYDHKIMMGIEKVPATQDEPYLYLEVFPVSAMGKEIASIKDVQSTRYYAGIVEKPLLLGKSLYFNYDPGYTPGILRNTLKYLR
ncbi:MAG: hypothetical protein NT067_01810 [Candidatus Diapherotrites archaeon]|nr:hypothetical protein [Candidatus Diapherotrites archaeon]